MKRGVVDIPFWITIVCFASLRMCKWLFLLVITYGKDWSFEVQHPLKHLAMNTDVCRFWTSQSRGYKIPSLTSYNPSFSTPPSQEVFQKPNRHGKCPLPENRLRPMYVCGRLAFGTKTIWTGLAIAKSLHFTSSTSFPKKNKELISCSFLFYKSQIFRRVSVNQIMTKKHPWYKTRSQSIHDTQEWTVSVPEPVHKYLLFR